MKKIILPFAFTLLTLCSYANTEKAELPYYVPPGYFHEIITMSSQGGEAVIFRDAIPTGYVLDVYFQAVFGGYDEKTTITPAVDGNGVNCLIINATGEASEEVALYEITVCMRDGYTIVGYLTIYPQ